MIRVFAGVLVAVAALAAVALGGTASAHGARSASGPPASQKHIIERAASGAVRAEFSYYVDVSSAYGTRYLNFRVSIFRSGKLALTSLLPFEGYSPAGSLGGGRSIQVLRLQADPEPQVVVRFWTGGVHCCQASTFYIHDRGANHYGRLDHNWGNGGASLKGAPGSHALFVGADDRFSYIPYYAAASPPIQVWRLNDLALQDVTSSEKTLVASDARTHWRAYLKDRNQPQAELRGVLAAYAADEARLGQWAHALEVLEQANARGEFDRPTDGPSGGQFIVWLTRSLKQWGYFSHP